MKSVEVTIEEDGKVTIEVNGVMGPSCEDYTKAIVLALNGDIISDSKKPEYYVTGMTTQRV